MVMPSNHQLSEFNQKWVLSGASIVITVSLFFGGTILKSHQAQIEKNQEKIWNLQSTAVTDDKLNRQIQQVQDYIDVRIQSLESSQREMARQLTVLVNDTKEARKEVRQSLDEIRSNLE